MKHVLYATFEIGYKGLILLFGAMMSFSTRSVSENFNESKPIALAIYNVLFTSCIIVPIALLTQSDGRTLYLLAIFGVYWITFCTLVIIFAPKVITIYKDASGLIAQRISDSKASASELTRSAQTGRTIKELAQQPVRLMDRMTLRTYVNLLEKELTMARASLATLDANEGILAGGHGGSAPSAVTGPRKSIETATNVSSHDVISGFGTTRTAFTGSVAGLSSPSNANNGARSPNASGVARSYQHNPNGQSRDMTTTIAQKQSSMINKFTGGSSIGGNGLRSIASVGPQPYQQQQSSIISSQPSSRNATPVESKMQVSIPGSQPIPDDINDSAVPSSPASALSRNVTTVISPNETRFRMPTNLNNNGSSHRPLIVTVGTPSASLVDAATTSSTTTTVGVQQSSLIGVGGSTSIGGSNGIPLSGSSHLITSHGRTSSGDENTSLLVHQPLSSPLSSASPMAAAAATSLGTGAV
jgi:hypothetical protein